MLSVPASLIPARALLAVLVPAVAGLLWLGIARATTSQATHQPERIYPLGVVWARLQHEPAPWLHRTLRVRAVAVQCAATVAGPGSPCIDQRPALIDAGSNPESGLLALLPAPTPRPLAWLRALPMIGRFAPGPPAPAWGIAMTYAIELQSAPCTAGSALPCYSAVLR